MKNLKQLLKTYIQKNPYEVNAIKMLNFFDNYDSCFEKDNLPGHFTGSAWIISPNKNKILILIELQGANDGLNTVIPYNQKFYYNLRPTIGIEKSKILTISWKTELIIVEPPGEPVIR